MSYSRSMVTSWGRWTATFIGFPLAGVTARLAVGGIDSPAGAVVGGLLGGAVLGVVQVVIGGISAVDRIRGAPMTHRARCSHSMPWPARRSHWET